MWLWNHEWILKVVRYLPLSKIGYILIFPSLFSWLIPSYSNAPVFYSQDEFIHSFFCFIIILLYLSVTFWDQTYICICHCVSTDRSTASRIQVSASTTGFEFSSLGLYIKVVFLFSVFFFSPRNYLPSTKIIFSLVYGVNLEIFQSISMHTLKVN